MNLLAFAAGIDLILKACKKRPVLYIPVILITVLFTILVILTASISPAS